MSSTFDCDDASYLEGNPSSTTFMDEEDTDAYYMGSRQASSNPGGGMAPIGGGSHATGMPSPYGLTLTIREALVRMRRDAESFRDLTCTSQAIALAILKHYSWSLVRARDSFFDARDAIFEKLHIADDGTCQREPDVQSNHNEVTCAICWDDCAPSTAVSLVACSHWVCKPCAHENCMFHVKQKGGELVSKRCPSAGCQQFTGEALFRAVLVDKAEWELYEESIVREYLSGNALMRWCANPKGQCNQIICVSSNRDTAHEVRCFACGTRFCFNCGDDAHGPATCEMLKAWRKKAEDDSETANWVAANTKTCPKCKKGIEKNGGCNHIVCACKHEWCWICEGDWSKHGSSWYQCNFYDPKANKAKDDNRGHAKESLQRYIFYFSRYANHLASQKLDAKVLAQLHQRINEEMATNHHSTLAPPRYLEDTAKVLFDCRHTLMYTYVYAYYLVDQCQRQLFEYQQAQLELATEELSMVIEGSKVMVAQAVVDKTATARQFHLEIAKGVWSQDK